MARAIARGAFAFHRTKQRIVTTCGGAVEGWQKAKNATVFYFWRQGYQLLHKTQERDCFGPKPAVARIPRRGS